IRPTLMVPSPRAGAAQTSAATAAIVLTTFMSTSQIEESSLPFALQDDVETVCRAGVLPAREQRAARGRIRDRPQHGIGVVGRLVREVDPGHQLFEQASREDGEIDV